MLQQTRIIESKEVLYLITVINMASICNTIGQLEEEIKAEFGSQAELANKLSEGDLMTQLF